MGTQFPDLLTCLREKTMQTYSSSELLTINAARLLRDGDVVFVGVGFSLVGDGLADRLGEDGGGT